MSDNMKTVEFPSVGISAGLEGSWISIGTLNFDFDKMTMKENMIKFHKDQAATVIATIQSLISEES